MVSLSALIRNSIHLPHRLRLDGDRPKCAAVQDLERGRGRFDPLHVRDEVLSGFLANLQLFDFGAERVFDHRIILTNAPSSLSRWFFTRSFLSVSKTFLAGNPRYSWRLHPQASKYGFLLQVEGLFRSAQLR